MNLCSIASRYPLRFGVWTMMGSAATKGIPKNIEDSIRMDYYAQGEVISDQDVTDNDRLMEEYWFSSRRNGDRLISSIPS